MSSLCGQNWLFNCLLEISTWISNRYLHVIWPIQNFCISHWCSLPLVSITTLSNAQTSIFSYDFPFCFLLYVWGDRNIFLFPNSFWCPDVYNTFLLCLEHSSPRPFLGSQLLGTQASAPKSVLQSGLSWSPYVTGPQGLPRSAVDYV